MTVVYPLAAQPDYTELKFSLRSLDTYLPKPFEVVIIGEKIPDWLNNVTWIQLPDIPGRKQISIRRKVLAALHLYDEILCMADDIYFAKPVIEFPYYCNGLLKTYTEKGSRQLHDELSIMKKQTKRFDNHFPIIYKRDFKEISELFSASVILKSMYCNYSGIEGIEHRDFKFIKRDKPETIIKTISDNNYFSSGPSSLPSLLPILHEMFTNKSNFEL